MTSPAAPLPTPLPSYGSCVQCSSIMHSHGPLALQTTPTNHYCRNATEDTFKVTKQAVIRSVNKAETAHCSIMTWNRCMSAAYLHSIMTWNRCMSAAYLHSIMTWNRCMSAAYLHSIMTWNRCMSAAYLHSIMTWNRCMSAAYLHSIMTWNRCMSAALAVHLLVWQHPVVQVAMEEGKGCLLLPGLEFLLLRNL